MVTTTMGKLFILSNGQFGPHPDDRSESVRLRHRFYITDNKCDTCDSGSLRLTHSDNCMFCQRMKVELTRIYSKLNDDDLHIVPWPEHISEKFFTPEFIADVVEARLLIRNEGYRLASEPCKTHGHIRLTKRSTDECYHCDQLLKPREQAVKDNNDTYISTSPCGGCNNLTMRKTDDRSCTSCGHVPNTKVDMTADAQMMSNNPDMVISKADSKSLNMKVYRTGKTCSKGHVGWRYVSTGNCIACIKGIQP